MRETSVEARRCQAMRRFRGSSRTPVEDLMTSRLSRVVDVKLPFIPTIFHSSCLQICFLCLLVAEGGLMSVGCVDSVL